MQDFSRKLKISWDHLLVFRSQMDSREENEISSSKASWSSELPEFMNNSVLGRILKLEERLETILEEVKYMADKIELLENKAGN